MTMTRCLTCGKDVHITHDEDECTGEPNLRTPNDVLPAELTGDEDER